MSDTTDALISIMERNFVQAQHHEQQRATLTGIIVIIASAIQGGLTQTGFNKNSLPLTITLIFLGVFGAVATLKLYERFKHHDSRSDNLLIRLDELLPEAQIMKRLDSAYNKHTSKYPRLSKSIRLHKLWVTLHILIAVLGIVYTFIIII